MPIYVQYDFLEDLRHRKFGMIAKLIREGDISALDAETLNFFADFLERDCKLEGPGAPPDKYREDLAEFIASEYESIRKYGRTTTEQSNHLVSKMLCNEKEGEMKTEHKIKGMTRSESYEKLKQSFPEISHLDFKGMETLITYGKKISNFNLERNIKDQFG